MKTSIEFQKSIRKNRRILVAAGINPFTVRSWAYGYRRPDLTHANRIAQILNMDVNKIPYRQVILNNP